MENVSKSGAKILSNYVGLISEHKVQELIHQITHRYHNYHLNFKHH